ncbi:hypothetical protein QQP08_027360 [Theobroma cacao]|nr:hypothetical protein QQP08_027360 [Theobroma cacao]
MKLLSLKLAQMDICTNNESAEAELCDQLHLDSEQGYSCITIMVHLVTGEVDKKAEMVEQLQNLVHALAFAAWGTRFVMN